MCVYGNDYIRPPFTTYLNCGNIISRCCQFVNNIFDIFALDGQKYELSTKHNFDFKKALVAPPNRNASGQPNILPRRAFAALNAVKPQRAQTCRYLRSALTITNPPEAKQRAVAGLQRRAVRRFVGRANRFVDRECKAYGQLAAPDTASPLRELPFHALFQDHVRLDARPVREHDIRRQISRPGDLLQCPTEYAFDHLRRKAMAERVADRRKARRLL